jgi:hypothetical protein
MKNCKRVTDLLHNGHYDDLSPTSISNVEMSMAGADLEDSDQINAEEIIINRTVMIEKNT